VRRLHVALHDCNADRRPAEAHGAAIRNLRWQLEAFSPHGLLPGVEGTIAAIIGEVGLRALGQKDTPGGL